MGMLTIAQTPVDAPEARLLMAKLSRTLARITGSDGRGRFHPEDVQEAGGTFLVAYLDGEPWGCGGCRWIRGKSSGLMPGPTGRGWSAGSSLPWWKGLLL